MEFLAALWLPIALSAVAVFVASSIIWTASPLHKNDYKNPGDKEEPLRSVLRTINLTPGAYFIPWCIDGNRKSPEYLARAEQGPWVLLSVMPAKPNMGKMLGLWFFHQAIIAILIGYISHHALKVGAPYLDVFRVVGAIGLLAHAGYALPMSIWHAMPWSQLPGRLVDGVIYALLTAGMFGWLWPKAAIAG